MTDTFDLASALNEWPDEPGKLDARHLRMPDGRMVLQLRVDLGLLQMECVGRPDGRRIEGHDSLLALCHSRLRSPGSSPNLDEVTCHGLLEESLQVLRRALTLQSLHLHELALADADSVLQRLDLCVQFAPGLPSTVELEARRGQLITLRTRSAVQSSVDTGDTSTARASLDAGLDALRRCINPEAFDSHPDVQVLRAMSAMLVPQLPSSQREELHARLRTAIAQENFELAAILRDELRQLAD